MPQNMDAIVIKFFSEIVSDFMVGSRFVSSE